MPIVADLMTVELATARRLAVLDAHGTLVGLLPIGKLARSETLSNAGETLQVISEPTGD